MDFWNTAPRFSSEIRARFAALGEPLDAFEEIVGEYEGRFQERFVPRRDASGRITLRDLALLCMLSAHARARSLTWGVVTAINTHSAPLLFLAARAHMEAAGMMAYVEHESRRFVDQRITREALERTLERVLLGRKEAIDEADATLIPENERVIHINDYLRSVDDLFVRENMPEWRGQFLTAYNWLSEFCHPNIRARLSERVVRDDEYLFYRRPGLIEADLKMALMHLGLSDFVVGASFEDFDDLIARDDKWITSERGA